MSRKSQKRLGKICQECSGTLELVSYVKEAGGVAYTEQYYECTECGHREKFKVSEKKYIKELFNPKF